MIEAEPEDEEDAAPLLAAPPLADGRAAAE
jgi:hypothetical protein